MRVAYAIADEELKEEERGIAVRAVLLAAASLAAWWCWSNGASADESPPRSERGSAARSLLSPASPGGRERSSVAAFALAAPVPAAAVPDGSTVEVEAGQGASDLGQRSSLLPAVLPATCDATAVRIDAGCGIRMSPSPTGFGGRPPVTPD